jgi:NAD(P)-dependent dehydrogenase (short-subunit alcohol dehydrogenase family)
VSRLDGTRVLVTGATSGLGLAMAEALVQTMTRRGFVPYGPAGAGVEALSRIMAADLAGTPVTVNLLLPGGLTATGMVPEDVSAETQAALLDPAIMGPPVVWLASEEAAAVHDQRIVATEFEHWLAQR